eukprot:SAG11_NODE_8262_length_1038_cov_0.933972_3_plen_55_part_01
MVDVHGPPWLTPRDAIALGKALEPYNLLFYEDPIAVCLGYRPPTHSHLHREAGAS